MARTIAEIKQSMIDQKNAESGLSGLTSTSSVAIWNLVYFICAVAIKVIEDLFDILQEDVEERKLEIPTGVLQWYAAESLVFQYGDQIVYRDNYVDENGNAITLKGKAAVYPVVDLDKRIVKLSAASESDGLVTIKVAKLTGGIAEPLAAGELTAFSDYWTSKRFAGTPLQFISVNPDLMKAYYSITYDPELLDNTGTLISDGVTKPVEAAIDNYLQSFQTEDFDGTLKVLKLTTAIAGAIGVLNAVATDIEAKADGGTYSDILAVSGQTYNSTAGYMKIDPLFPLSTTITYST